MAVMELLARPVRPASVVREVRSQLDSFQRRVDFFVRGRMLDAGKRWKRRVTTERMSAPPAQELTKEERRARRNAKGPIGRKTGQAIRSVNYYTRREGDSFVLKTSIGERGAAYVDQYEDRIHSQRILDEVMRQTMEEIRLGLDVIARDPRGAAGTDIPDAPAPDLPVEAIALRSHFDLRSSIGRERASLRREVRRRRESAFDSFGRLSGGARRLLGRLP